MYGQRINMGTLLPFYQIRNTTGDNELVATDIHAMHNGTSSLWQMPYDRLIPFLIPFHMPALTPETPFVAIYWLDDDGTQHLINGAGFSYEQTDDLPVNDQGWLGWWNGDVASTGLLETYCGHTGRIMIVLDAAQNFVNSVVDRRRAISAHIRLIGDGKDQSSFADDDPDSLVGYERFVIEFGSSYRIQGHTDAVNFVVNPPTGYSEHFFFAGYMDIPEIERVEELLINRLGQERVMSASTRTRAQMDMADVPYDALPCLGRLADYEHVTLWRHIEGTPFALVDGAGGNMWGMNLNEAYPTVTFTQLNNLYARGRLSWTQERVFKTSCAVT